MRRTDRLSRLGLEPLEDRTVPTLATAAYANLMAGLQQGASWGNTTSITATMGANDLLNGDFNGDGAQDFAGLSADGTWVVLESDRGHFVPTTFAQNWSGKSSWVYLFAGDFNGDGKTDVAGLHTSGEWWVGLSTGTSFVSQRWSAGWSVSGWLTMQAADFTGDGRTDIVALDSAGTWWIVASTGQSFTTSYAGPHWAGGDVWRQFLVGDFNGDGLPDIAALHQSGEWWVALATGAGLTSSRWMPHWVDNTNWDTFVVGDFDGDGKDDIAGFYNAGKWFVAHSTGSSFTTQIWDQNWAGSTNWLSFQVGDFDGDGKDEIAAEHVSGEWWVIGAAGTGTVTKRWSGPAVPVTTYTGLPAADYNGDGRPDVAMVDTNGNIYIGQNTWTQFLFGTTAPGESDFITPWDVNQIRLDPDSFGTLFARYKDTLRKELGPAFAGLSDDGLALVFASTLSYELASYRGLNDPEGTFPVPVMWNQASMLSVPKLVCNEYDTLALTLYRTWNPWTAGEPEQIQMVGWDHGSFGNHAQMLVTGVGVPLLLDPTTGLVAATDLASLSAGTPLAAADICQVSVRVESTAYMQGAMSTFRGEVLAALEQGLYPQNTQLYLLDMDAYRQRNDL